MTEITICSGTLCYIMGGADLFDIEASLTRLFGEDIRVKASACLGYCEGEPRQNPPCVLINDELIADACIEKIIYHLKNRKK